MKSKRFSRKLLAAVLVLAMVVTLLPVSAFAAMTSVGQLNVITRTNYSITQGVSVSKYIVRDRDGEQSVGYMTSIDLSGDVKLVASYTGYYTPGSTAESRVTTANKLAQGGAWNMSQTTQQAAAYEKSADAAGKVVWGTNGDYYNMQSGSPTGYLIMEGNLIKTGDEPFFAILKDGTAVIRDAGSDTSDVQEAVSGPFYLIKDGVICCSDDNTPMPRNSVGLKADGTVVFFEADGRQAPYSAGLSVYETACMLYEAGCVTAIYLDGGGSATVAARTEGSNGLKVFNSPSDGIERTVSSAFLLVNTKEGTGYFDHAVVTPTNEQYTMGSTIAFEAAGVDSAGGEAALPEGGLNWVLDTAAAGTIDAATGTFTAAAGFTGEVTVHVENAGKNVGSTTVVIAEPDEIAFTSDSMSLDFAETTDLGLTVSSGQLPINYKDGDFVWTITPDDGVAAEQFGTITDNIFTSGAKTDSTLRGTLTVSYTNAAGEVLSASIKLEIGKMPVVLMDFETQQKNGIDEGANSTWGNFYNTNNHMEKGIAGVVNTVAAGARGDGVLGFGTADGQSVDPNGITIPATLERDEYGRYGIACGDFINGTGACSCWHDAPYGWDCPNDPGLLFNKMGYDWTVGGMASATDSSYDMYVKRVDAETGEVRFGEHALEFHYDYTKINGSNNTNEYLVYTGDPMIMEGTPSAIGMWVYAPEGTPNFWFTTYVAYWNGSAYAQKMLHFKSTTVNGAGQTVATTTQYTGINWTGWQYMEADLAPIIASAKDIENHPICYMPGSRVITMMIIEGGTPDVDGNKITCGGRKAGSLYIDNIRAVYGTTVDDMENPVIDSVKAGPASETNYENLSAMAADGSTVIDTNDVQIFTQYYDPAGENATGISVANTTITVDGNPLTVYGNTDQAVANVTLSNGKHTVTVEVMDGFGNKTSKTYDFTVAAEDSQLPSIDLTADAAAVIGGTYNIKVSSEDISNIASVTLTASYGNSAIFDAAVYADPRLTSATVTYGDGFTGREFKHTMDKGNTYITTNYEAERKIATKMVVAMTADAVEGAEGASDIVTFSMPVPKNLTATDNLPMAISVKFTTKDGAEYTLGTASTVVPTAAYYTITSGAMISGAENGVLTVTDLEGNPAEGVTLKVGSDVIGTTAADGTLTTDVFTKKEAGAVTVVMAEKDGMPSFNTNIKTMQAGGSADGKPSQIQLNATQNAAENQNITWLSNPNGAAAKAVVEYATSEKYAADGAFDQNAEGTATLHQFTISNDAAYINAVSLTGLAPATEYSYRVGDGQTWSDVRTFTTTAAGADTNFFIIGDTQLNGNKDADAAEIALMNAIAQSANTINPTFGVQTGDFVDNGGRLYQWEEILDVFDENYGTIPMVQVMGNHEYYGDTAGTAAEQLWTVPDELYYSVEYGNVYVAVINYAANLEEACAWLVEDATKSDCRWKVLTVHQPAYFTNPGGSSDAFNRYIPAAAEEAGIDAVFSGHDHSYARTEKLTGGEVDEKYGTVYMICGDLGEKSRNSSYKAVDNPDFHFAKVAQDYTAIYVAVTATEEEMVITAYDVAEDGTATPIDTVTLKEYICDEHTYVYDRETGELSCSECIYTADAKEIFYTGFVTEKETGRMMYLNGGEPVTHYLHIGTETYYFDAEGLAYEGEYEMCGETVEFHDGQYVVGSNPNVVLAGKAGDEADFIVTTDGLLYVDGTGKTYAHETAGTVQWYSVRRDITSIRVGADIEGLGAFTFAGLPNLTEVYYEEGSKITNTPNYCFAYDSKIETIILPDSVQTVGYRAFAGCSNLSFLYIPDGVYYFGNLAFVNTPNVVLSVADASRALAYAQKNNMEYLVRGTCEGAHDWSEWTYYTCADNDHTGYRICAACGEVELCYSAMQFVDVVETAFYAEPVVWAVENNITTGMDETTFGPDLKCTRGQIVTFLWRAAGCPEPTTTECAFTDVSENAFYYKAMLWAVENGITNGLTETTFGPNEKCTRGQAVTFLWRANGCPEPTTTDMVFTDVAEGRFYYKAILWAVENGIAKGMTDDTYAPERSCTRGQVVTFLYRDAHKD